MTSAEISTVRVLEPADRLAALEVIRQVYQDEKRWVRDPEQEIAETLSTSDRVSWFLVRVGGEPAGVLRLWYDFSIELPAELEVTIERPMNLEAARSARWVEVGRFMILPEHRSATRVALALMKAAVTEVVERGYTHFITDVYDGDPHSPLKFHTRVLGFERIGTHRFGELDCDCVRIILILDLVRAYRLAKAKKNKIFRALAEGLQDKFEALPETRPVLV